MASSPSKSPKLVVPRKSTELEDSGLHDIESSNDESEDFADASEGDAPLSPVPITRVEKVDESPRHGEVPGTSAYAMRTQDAVPDEIAVVPDGSSSRSPSRSQSDTPGGTPVPKTLVEKVDPASPSHGEVPGTEAHTKRQADAAPDVVAKAPKSSLPGPTAHGQSIPKIAEPTRPTSSKSPPIQRSPIAADGGFGPMPSDDELDDSQDADGDVDDTKGAGEDFDDFAEGEEVDDFGDFDDGFEAEEEEQEEVQPSRQPVVPITPKFPMLNPSEITSLDSLLAAAQPHLDALFPATVNSPLSSAAAAPSRPAPPSTFLADRSASLWAQLAAPPPLQPPDWVRSRIRRLFLISLGVPVNLDEILPAAGQKKLVLPYHPGAAGGNPALARAAAAGGDGAPATPTSAGGGGRGSSKRRRAGGLPEPPAFDAAVVREVSSVSEAGLAAMGDEELRKHVAAVEECIAKGQEVLAYWVRRKEAAVGEKEAFDGVIENLVRHARKVRQ